MRKVLLFASLLLSACATAATYNQSCFQENTDFALAVECTKRKLTDDPRSHLPINQAFTNELFPYMDMIAVETKGGKITATQGQYLIADKINELDRIQRAQINASDLGTSQSNVSARNTVYGADECIGPIVAGKCHGQIVDKGGYHKTCHGEWLNGQCTGPMF